MGTLTMKKMISPEKAPNSFFESPDFKIFRVEGMPLVPLPPPPRASERIPTLLRRGLFRPLIVNCGMWKGKTESAYRTLGREKRGRKAPVFSPFLSSSACPRIFHFPWFPSLLITVSFFLLWGTEREIPPWMKLRPRYTSSSYVT